MAGSVVTTVQAALITRLTARTALNGVQITDGLPVTPNAEYIAVLDADPHTQTAAGMRATGPRPREEEFEILVQVSVLREGDTDHATVTARAFALAAEIEADLQTDPTIGASLGNGWATVTGLPVRKYGPTGKGAREAVIGCRITCKARI